LKKVKTLDDLEELTSIGRATALRIKAKMQESNKSKQA